MWKDQVDLYRRQLNLDNDVEKSGGTLQARDASALQSELRALLAYLSKANKYMIKLYGTLFASA